MIEKFQNNNLPKKLNQGDSSKNSSYDCVDQFKLPDIVKKVHKRGFEIELPKEYKI